MKIVTGIITFIVGIILVIGAIGELFKEHRLDVEEIFGFFLLILLGISLVVYVILTEWGFNNKSKIDLLKEEGELMLKQIEQKELIKKLNELTNSSLRNYFYLEGDKQIGPFTFENLKNENIKKETLIWFEGLDDWKLANDIKELDEILELNPPPIQNDEFYSETKSSETYNKSEESKSFVRKKQGMFSKPFSFDGRIRRREYGISMIIYVIVTTFFNAIVASGEAPIIGLAYIPMLWFLWAQGAKRCHDLGNNGWWQIIPFYGLWMLFQNGQPGRNIYGINPKD